MININLTTREEKAQAGSLGREWGGFLFAVVAIGLIYLGALSYNNWLGQKLEEKNAEYQTKHSSVMEKGKNVFDFQNRLETAKSLVAEKNYAVESLGQIEKAIIPEVYVESFIFDSKKDQIDMTCVTRRYNLVANQIASLKRMDYFSEIGISKTNTREDGNIEFFLGLKIKDKQIKK